MSDRTNGPDLTLELRRLDRAYDRLQADQRAHGSPERWHLRRVDDLIRRVDWLLEHPTEV